MGGGTAAKAYRPHGRYAGEFYAVDAKPGIGLLPMSIELYNVDCMEYMREQSDKAFDLAMVDPPYGVGFKYNSHDDSDNGYYDWCSLWFEELKRISKCQVLTVGYKNNAFWYQQGPKHCIVWIKDNQCSASPLGGFNCYELVFIFGENKKRIKQDIMKFPVKQQKKADFHPCPKEITFWTHLMNMFIDEGDSVFDAFLGSGTSAVSAHNLGARFVGCEVDEHYFNLAKQRIEQETRQIALF